MRPAMTQFDQALALVHDTLSEMRANSSAQGARASMESVRHLLTAARVEKPGAAKTSPSTPATSGPAEATSTRSAATGLAARTRALIESASRPTASPTPAPVPRPVPMPRIEGVPKAAALPPLSPSVPSSGSKAERLEQLRQRVVTCLKCDALVASRSNVVFGVGNPEAELMFVGEAPGADEDLEGEPFVGKAGQLLTKIIEAAGFQRSQVYIANVLKCRPGMLSGESGDRKPSKEEMATCLPFLIEQIEIIKPKCIVALGTTAMEGLLGKEVLIRDVRGRWHSFKGIPLMPTYHPAYLLRNQSLTEKRKVWEDILLVLELLGKQITPKQRNYFLTK